MRQLEVKRIDQKDIGRGIARVDPKFMEEYDLEGGDILRIEINGKEDVVRIVPGYRKDAGRDTIRLEGIYRQLLDINLGQKVTPSKVEETHHADHVEVKLAASKLGGNKEVFEQRIREELSKIPFMEGSLAGMQLLGSRKIPFRVEFVKPNLDDDAVYSANHSTHIEVTTGNLSGQGSGPERRHSPERMNTLSDLFSNMPGAGGGQQDQKPQQSQQQGKDSKWKTELRENITYDDVGGLNEELEKIREMVELPLRHPDLFDTLGIDPPKGVLLHGPPGTGKTLLAKAVANEVKANNFYQISGPEILSKFYGESEGQLREVFEEAQEDSPAIIFIDELDSIAPNRNEASGDVEKRIVAELLSQMDGLEKMEDVIVIGATNRVDQIDPALRRGGRFDREIEIGVPDREGRKEILQIHTRGMPLEDEVDLDKIAAQTHGYVGADLANLAKESAMNVLEELKSEINYTDDDIPPEVYEKATISKRDFEEALREVEPSAMRELFVETPDITYEDVGGLEEVKEALVESVEWPVDNPEIFEEAGISPPKGTIMYGPPGTGKTLLAKAVANESESNFISIKGPELLNKYVGESEKGIRQVFKKARQNAPSVIFFDEIDAIAPERGGSQDNNVTERVVSQLLTELDGIEPLSEVKVIATTNRPDLIDNALLRPGRFDNQVRVPIPDEEARKEILNIHTRDTPKAESLDIDALVEKTEGYTGSDIESLCREATMKAVRRVYNEGDDQVKVKMKDFEEALEDTVRSVDEEQVQKYDEVEERINKSQPKKEEADSHSFM